MGHKYRSYDKLAELINEDSRLLQVMSRFGISLGFGDKSVEEVCQANRVDVNTFIAVCNFVSQGLRPSYDEYGNLDVKALLDYLRNSHSFFLDFKLPSIRREFVDAVDCSTQNEIGFLILKFFDDYAAEIKRHQEYESKHFFSYVDGLIQGKRSGDMSIQHFENNQGHQDHDKLIAQRIDDLKKIIIRYSPSSANKELLNDALLHLFEFEADYESHTLIEDTLFIPAASMMESQVDIDDDKELAPEEPKEVLSDREKDILVGVVKGQTNKEIADSLFLSVHTVLTHRRNIARKLEIHSPAGLVIYAIVNGIVKMEDIKGLSFD